jgi:hypothetical protein
MSARLHLPAVPLPWTTSGNVRQRPPLAFKPFFPHVANAALRPGACLPRTLGGAGRVAQAFLAQLLFFFRRENQLGAASRCAVAWQWGIC